MPTRAHLESGGKMMITLAGAMSTAELGVSLAEMIRQDKVHAITCTGANFEEESSTSSRVLNTNASPIIASSRPRKRRLFRRHLNRVTDTCIPEEYAIRRIEKTVIDGMDRSRAEEGTLFPARISFQDPASSRLKEFYEIDPADSWMMAASEKNLPIFVPGWEDSTLGNIYAARKSPVNCAMCNRSARELNT